jgi:hypothetical protein
MIFSLLKKNAIFAAVLLLGVYLGWPESSQAGEMRFPAPEFVSEYTFPETTIP